MNIIEFILYPALFNISLNIFYEIKRYFNLISFDKPFDFGLSFFDGRRILGESTTWGGLFVIILISFILGLFVEKFSIIFYLVALSVFFGHAIGSFIKRRLGIKRGDFLIFVDHLDYIYLSGFVLMFKGIINLEIFLIGILIIFILHPIVTYSFYKLGFRENPL